MSQQTINVPEPLRPTPRFQRRLVDTDPPGTFKLAKDAINSEWAGAWAFRRLQRVGMEVDPSFNPFTNDDIFKQLTEGLDPSLWEGYRWATSMTQALVIREQLQSVQESRQRLGEAGLKGLGISLVAMVIDPAFIAAEVFTFGVAGPVILGARSGRLARFVQGGIVTGVSEASVQAYLSTEDPQGETMDILYAGAGAFMLGGGANVLFGRAARRLQKKIEFVSMAKASMGAAAPGEFQPGAIRRIMDRILTREGKEEFRELLDPETQRKLADEFIDGLGVDDATKAELRQIAPADLIDSVPTTRGDPDIDAMYESLARPGEPPKPPKTPGEGVPDEPKFPKRAGDLFINATSAIAKWSPIRWSMAGRLGRADSSPLMRMTISALAEDALPKLDGTSNAANASSFGRRTFASVMGRYYRFANNEWKAWARETQVSPLERAAKQEEFYQRVGMAIRRQANSADDAHVQAVANLQRQLNEELLGLGQRHGVKGLAEVEANATYLSRLYSPSRIHKLVAQVGESNVVDLLASAFVRGSDELDPKIAQKIGRGFLRVIVKIDDPSVIHRGRVFEQGTREALEDVLREPALELSERQIDDILSFTLKPESPEKGAIPRARRRMRMDETASINVNDDAGNLVSIIKIEDLLENNAATILELYARQITGAAGMAEALRAINQATGRIARKAGADLAEDAGPKPFDTFDDLLAELKREGTASKADIQRIETVAKSVLGRRLGNNTPVAGAMRKMRLFNHLRMSGQFGIAQLPEYANIAATGGFVAMVQQMPALARIFRRAATGRLENDLLDEIETLTGLGLGRMMDNVATRFDQSQGILEYGGGTLDRVLRRGAKFSNDISFMAPVTMHQQRMMGVLAAQKFANIAKGGRKIGKRRMADLGLDEAMADRVSAQMRKHSDITDEGFVGGRLRRINLDDWDDIEAASRFVDGIARWSNRAVQMNDIGNLSRWMTGDVGRVVLQYRSFMMVAWEKQFLHKFAMADWTAFAEAATATMIAGLAYAAQQNVNALGRTDKDEFLADKLGEGPLGFNPWKLGAAAAQRAGYSSIIPSVVDTLGYGSGFEPIFNARNTELENVVWGNPSLQFVKSLLPATAGVGKAIRGVKDFNQADARRINRLLPFKQVLGIKNVVNAFISQFPER